MDREQIIFTIAQLGRSQGSYTRLSYHLHKLEEENPDEYERCMTELENQHFKDAVDLIMYFEC